MKDDAARCDAWNRDCAPQYPHEKAIQFILRRFAPAERPGLRVFEPGCGNGRNLEFLVREGLVPVGRDISAVAVAQARARLAPWQPDPDIDVASLGVPDVPENSCDALFWIGVVDAAGPGHLHPALEAALAVLRPGAPAMFLFASPRDFRVLGPNPLGLHGCSEAEVDAALAALGPLACDICRDRYITTYDNQSHAQDEHLITFARAPA